MTAPPSEASSTASTRGAVVTVVLAMVLLWVFHGALLRDINDSYLTGTGDGIKSYYGMAYHVRHDATFSRFEGMGYPYQEQVVLSVSQPALSNGMKLVSTVFDLGQYTRGTMHAALLASMVACALLVFLILGRKGLPVGYAVPAALAVTFLSPQMLRLPGHFGLSYLFVVPLVWWLAIRFDERPTWQRSVAIGLTVFLVSGLHLYYLALAGAFLTFRWGFRWLQRENRRHSALFAAKHWAVQVFAPFLVLQTWLSVTNTVTDRPVPPPIVGELEGMLLPVYFPLGRLIDRLIPISVNFENLAYLGWPAALFTVALLVWAMTLGRWRAPALPFNGKPDPELAASLAAATTMVAIGLGFPFLGPLSSLREYAGPFGQFRALGRFSWAFFYVVNVATFVYLYRRTTNTSRRQMARSVLLLALVVLGAQAWYYNTHIARVSLARVPELEAGATPPWLDAVEPGRYQAIMPLPYFHEGAEHARRPPSDASLRNTLVMSWLTGLPTTAVYSSRVSLSQTLALLQLVQEPYGEPALWQQFDGRPFLVRVQKGEPLSTGERWLRRAATPIFEDADQQLLALDPAAWRRSWQRHLDSTAQHAAALADGSGSPNQAPFAIRSFDDTATARSYRGPGAWRGGPRRTDLFAGALPGQDTLPYTASAWVALHDAALLRARLVHQEYLPDGTWVRDTSMAMEQLLTMQDGDWGLLEFRFTPAGPDLRQEIFLYIHGRPGPVAWIDEVLVRRTADDIALHRGDEVFLNGRFYALPPETLPGTPAP
jgi:hypothetical protein